MFLRGNGDSSLSLHCSLLPRTQLSSQLRRERRQLWKVFKPFLTGVIQHHYFLVSTVCKLSLPAGYKPPQFNSIRGSVVHLTACNHFSNMKTKKRTQVGFNNLKGKKACSHSGSISHIIKKKSHCRHSINKPTSTQSDFLTTNRDQQREIFSKFSLYSAETWSSFL